MVKNLPAVQEAWVPSLGREDSPGRGHDNPLQFSCLENSMDREAWRAVAHGSRTEPLTLSLTLLLPPKNGRLTTAGTWFLLWSLRAWDMDGMLIK